MSKIEATVIGIHNHMKNLRDKEEEMRNLSGKLIAIN